jgi:hypothetical protein
MNNTWKFLALLTIPEVSQMDPGTGQYEYPALLITRRGAALSFELGAFRSGVRLHGHGTTIIRSYVADSANQFRSIRNHNSHSADVYERLLKDFVDHREDLKRRAAEQDVESMREAGRTQNYSRNNRGAKHASRG